MKINTNKNVRVFLTYGLAIVFLFVSQGCSCQKDPYFDKYQIISELDACQKTVDLGSMYKNLDRPIGESYVDCFVDNSYGMLGFQNRTPADSNPNDQGIGHLIKTFANHSFRELVFRSFDDSKKENGMKKYNKSEQSIFGSKGFYSGDETPMTRNIEYIIDRIEDKKEIDGAFIVTDGIEDTGFLTVTVYAQVISDWVKKGNQFQLISLPILFRGKRWYAPPIDAPIKQKNSFFEDFTKQPTTQYLYILAFSNKTFSNKTLGEYLLKRVKNTFPDADIDYMDFSENLLDSNLSITIDEVNGATYQNKYCEIEDNYDLGLFERDEKLMYTEYYYNKKRQNVINTYDENDDEISVEIDPGMISMGKISGGIKTPDVLDLSEIKTNIMYTVIVFEEKLTDDNEVEKSAKTILLQRTIPIKFSLTELNDQTQLELGFKKYYFESDNILIEKPSIDKASVFVKLSILLPDNLVYGKNINTRPKEFGQCLLYIEVEKKENIEIFRGLNEKGIFESFEENLDELKNVSILNEYIQINF